MLLNYTLRDYQQACIEAFWTYLCNQQGNPVLVIPTGGGKSVVLADIFRQMIEVGRRGLLVTHRKELISQNAEKIRAIVHSNRFGGDLCGIYSAGTVMPNVRLIGLSLGNGDQPTNLVPATTAKN